MNKKTLIIGGGLLILLYFGYNSYMLSENKNLKYSTENKTQKSVIQNNTKIINNRLFKENDTKTLNVNLKKEESSIKKTTKLKSINNGQTFFKFSSTLYDIEVNGYTVQTKEELTYHTIDLNKEIVKMESKSNGKWIEVTYPIKKWYKEEGPYSTTYVFIIKSLGVQEVWWIPKVPSLGYDYDDGKRIACYNITRIK